MYAANYEAGEDGEIVSLGGDIFRVWEEENISSV